jgi:hypothetical protein
MVNKKSGIKDKDTVLVLYSVFLVSYYSFNYF